MSEAAGRDEAGDWPLDRLMVVGTNHRRSSEETRDRLFIDEARLPQFLGVITQARLGQAVVVSTCNRTEIHLLANEAERGRERVIDLMALWADLDRDQLAAELYIRNGREALRHVFAVAASLDSLVIGEPEVFGQIKDAHKIARAHGLVGRELEQVYQTAYAISKKVRSQTGIGQGAVSIAAAAQSVARDLHGDIGNCALLLAGAGDMGELIAASLAERGIGRIMVTDRLTARARLVARRLECHWSDMGDLDRLLAEADIVLTAGGSRRYLINREIALAAVKRRRYRPVLMIDTAVPGDIDPQVDDISEVFYYRLEDLEKIAAEGRGGREEKADEAWAMVEAEVDHFVRVRAERAAIPALAELRQHFDAVRASALAESHGDAEKATRLLVNRLLHAPTQALKDLAATTGGAGTMEWVKAQKLLGRLFPLHPAEDDQTDRQDPLDPADTDQENKE
ncbi:glutamyl-tRNA reductase [Thalassospira marina]|uniref:Glutamyl-tRNA reductase n=1 Tax=Thalassospira marina TaxID=2048283 RepID=A0A2N3KRA7_9PROT|nr:glutamyl-tRNA reductase [Thalassospira marina]AUG53555.1 glutamyl-tRNA reductase [Thalassospira marina]PKR53087.1 glutamyl-tRNA reductase [Thalassospira marina]